MVLLEDTSGVYRIINIDNGKVYVGSSVNCNKRIKTHLNRLKNNNYFNPHLQNSYNKYGVQYFDCMQIETVDRDKLIEREQFWIDYYDACNDGYNIVPKANKSEMSDETKSKISNSLKGMKAWNKGKKCYQFAGKNNPMFGNPRKDLQKLFSGEGNPMFGKKAWNSGEKMPEEHCIKFRGKRNGMYGKKGKLNPFYGKKHSEETRKKMSEAQKRRFHNVNTS